jgi:hypothetical protein
LPVTFNLALVLFQDGRRRPGHDKTRIYIRIPKLEGWGFKTMTFSLPSSTPLHSTEVLQDIVGHVSKWQLREKKKKVRNFKLIF